MSLSAKQKKYLKKHIRNEPVEKIALSLGVSVEEVKDYVKKRWGGASLKKVIERVEVPEISLKEKILNFNFRIWLNKNRLILIFLTLLVFAAYLNSLKNEFLSDDIASILENKNLDNFSYILSNPIAFLRPLFYFLITKIFGRQPIYYRLLNLFFHLGTTLSLFLLISLLADQKIAVLTSLIFAVHPLLIEAVAWISGGPYSQYSFFIILALVFFLFSIKKSKFFIFSILSLILALLSSEKAIVFPLIILLLMITFPKDLKNWKQFLIFSLISGFWILTYIFKLPQRISSLETAHYQNPVMDNPFFQIPVAISSYLELILWPKNLTLYHSEMSFSQTEYFMRLAIFIIFLGVIFYYRKRQPQIFFWLAFFFISLLPTLTPFGIASIVAERYVYLGSIGIFVFFVISIRNLSKTKDFNFLSITVFSLIIISLLTRTIFRNIDWKNQDNLWLAAARTSPSSPQNHNNLGDYYGRHGNLQRAIEEFKYAIYLRPNYGDAYHNLGHVYQQLKQFDKAVENYQQAIKINPGLWESYQMLANIYFDQGKLGESENYLIKALKINPENPGLLYNLAIIYLKENKTNEAKKTLERVLYFEPNNQEVKNLFNKLP